MTKPPSDRTAQDRLSLPAPHLFSSAFARSIPYLFIDGGEAPERTLRVVGDLGVVRPEAIVVETGVPQDISPGYPYPTKKLVAYVIQLLGQTVLTTNDVAAVLKRNQSAENRPDLYHCNQVKGSAPRFAQAEAEWMVEQIHADPDFLPNQRLIEHDQREAMPRT